MDDYLFANFLSDPTEYAQAESVWNKSWLDLLGRVGQESLWQSPWANTTFANGSACRDGNPIFSAVSPQRQLGVRVIQLEPGNDPQEFAVWTDTFTEGDPEAIKELIISCVLTKQTLRQAVELMLRWISEGKVQLPGDTDAKNIGSQSTEALPPPTMVSPNPSS